MSGMCCLTHPCRSIISMVMLLLFEAVYLQRNTIMHTISITQNVSGDFYSDILLPGLVDVDLDSFTSTTIDIFNTSDPLRTTQLAGTDFTFDGDTPTGGIVTSITFNLPSGQIAQITGMSQSLVDLGAAVNMAQSGDFTLFDAMLDAHPFNYDASGATGGGVVIGGTSNDDQLIGSDGNDNLKGSGGDDTLDGGANDDLLKGGAGADNIDGGNGFDTASYFLSSSGVTVSLATGTGTGGDAQGDTLANIESLKGSGLDDTLIGGVGDNILTGGNGDDYLLDLSGGNDTLNGGDGDDRMQGSGGANIYDGGDGTDEVRYNNSGAAVVVSLGVGLANGGDAEGDTFANVENLVGSQFNDILIGDDGANRLEGFLGDDTLAGGLGADVLWGGLGFDTANYSDSAIGVDARLFSTGSGGTAEGDTLIYIERIVGSQFNDTLIGGGASVRLDGLNGDDILFDYSANATLIGGNGNDFMQGGIGGDTYFGGSGTDTVSFANAVGAVTANLATGTGSGNDAAGDAYTGVENLLGSANSDTFIGDGNDNNLNGQGGVDFLLGGLGNDTLTGGAGVDLFQYDATVWGFDIITDFQNGTDFIDLRGSGLTFTDFTEVDTVPGMRLDYTDGGGTLSTISLLGVNIADIDASDFLV